jgi:hypothetical protein
LSVLTTQQLAAFKTALTTDPAYAAAIAVGDDTAAAAVANQDAAPDYYVWRTTVSEDEYTQTAGVDVANANAATTFSWTGAGYITRNQGERDAWARLFRSGSTNPSLANVRQAFSDILSGATAPAPANRNHMLVKSKRKATRAEKLYATGTGTYASPAVLGYEGGVTADDVRRALNS